MSQVKFILLAFSIAASFNANADVMSGYLNLSKLWGKTDAGQYHVGLALIVKDSATLEVTQKLSAPPSEDQPGSEPQVCLTEFRVNAGQLTLILTDTVKDSSTQAAQNISIYASYFDETEKCSSVDALLQSDVGFMPYFNLGTITMNYRAPKDYDEIRTALSVFPFGYHVNLKFEKNSDGSYTAANLKSQLSAQVIRGNKEALSYYTYAQKENSSLSLGYGFIELK